MNGHFLKQRQRRRSGIRFQQLKFGKPHPANPRHQPLPDQRFIIQNQQMKGAHGSASFRGAASPWVSHGRCKVKVEPSPGRLSTRMP